MNMSASPIKVCYLDGTKHFDADLTDKGYVLTTSKEALVLVSSHRPFEDFTKESLEPFQRHLLHVFVVSRKFEKAAEALLAGPDFLYSRFQFAYYEEGDKTKYLPGEGKEGKEVSQLQVCLYKLLKSYGHVKAIAEKVKEEAAEMREKKENCVETLVETRVTPMSLLLVTSDNRGFTDKSFSFTSHAIANLVPALLKATSRLQSMSVGSPIVKPMSCGYFEFAGKTYFDPSDYDDDDDVLIVVVDDTLETFKKSDNLWDNVQRQLAEFEKPLILLFRSQWGSAADQNELLCMRHMLTALDELRFRNVD